MKLAEWVNLMVAVATGTAAWFAYLAAKAARKQAEAAWAQVDLQRPRPIVTIRGEWSVAKLDERGPRGFLLVNLGTSPAFDVDISEISGPVLRTANYAERLVTDRTFAVGADPIYVTHYQCMPGTTLTEHAVARFLLSAAEQGFSIHSGDGNAVLEHELNFAVSYSAADGRRFRTDCRIRFNLGLNVLRAWVEPVSTWLGTRSK